MGNLPDFNKLIPQLLNWMQKYVLTIDSATQAGWLVLSIIAGLAVVRLVSPFFNRLEEENKKRWFSLIIQATRSILTPFFSLIFMMLYPTLAAEVELGTTISRVFQNLLGAWIAIRFFSSFIQYPAVAKWLAIFVWSLAALNTFGMLDDVIKHLDAVGFTMGDARVSLLIIIKGAFTFATVFWGATMLASISEKRIQHLHQLTPSLRVLIVKMIRISFIFFAIIIGLNTLGIDLTSLAVFSGAIGVGIGFGLQKVVSNFISGIILLLDRSIKPGDVIAIDETYGWVNKLSARHVSVITRDGKEHLIPNELLITERVENWSYSNRDIRLKIPVGISYNADPRLALKLILEAAAETPRVLKTPKPNALVTGFGDSSVNLELRAWIDDPANGISNISSDLFLAIWDKFQEHGVEIPYPQRDVYIKEGKLTS